MSRKAQRGRGHHCGQALRRLWLLWLLLVVVVMMVMMRVMVVVVRQELLLLLLEGLGRGQEAWLDVAHRERRHLLLFHLWLKLERGHRRLLWFLLVPLFDDVVTRDGGGHKLVVKLVLKLLVLKVLLGRGRG